MTYHVAVDTLYVDYGGNGNQLAKLDIYSANFSFDGVAPEPVASAAPKPATWAMMLVGFGTMGASIRYRRRSNKAVCA